jgi:4'-phosphopantetheinyl transferase
MAFRYSELWKRKPDRLRLGDNEVHVWAVELNIAPDETQKLERLLCSEERVRAKKFLLPAAGRRFTVARAVLRTLLGWYLDIDGSALFFGYGTSGKPHLNLGSGAPEFNLAHSDDLALIAVSAHRLVGIDLEKRCWDVSLEAVAARYFAESESMLVRNASPENKPEIFFSIWTMKEAILKAAGVGLAADLRSVEMMPNRRMHVQRLGRSWAVQSLAGIDGFSCALAIESDAGALSCYRWKHPSNRM